MCINIEMHRLPRKKLEDELMTKIPQINDRVLLEKILDCFGTTYDDNYIILCNEFYEDGNCYYQLPDVINRVFRLKYEVDNPFSIILDLSKEILGYKETEDAFDELGLDINDYPDLNEYKF